MCLAVQVRHAIYRVSEQRDSCTMIPSVGKELSQARAQIDKLNTADARGCLPLLRALKRDDNKQLRVTHSHKCYNSLLRSRRDANLNSVSVQKRVFGLSPAGAY